MSLFAWSLFACSQPAAPPPVSPRAPTPELHAPEPAPPSALAPETPAPAAPVTVAAAAPAAVAAPADPAPADPDSRVAGSVFDLAEFVALSGDRLLLWNPQGRAKLRSPTGEWRELELPLTGVMDVRAEGEGFLILGYAASAHAPAVSSLSAEGKELQRWLLPDTAAAGARIDAARARVLSRSGVLELKGDGSVTGPLALEPEQHSPVTARQQQYQIDGMNIVCHAADPSAQPPAPGHCRRSGAKAWDFAGQFLVPPIACGAWLVVRSSEHGAGLQIRDAASGKLKGEKSFASAPELSCAGADQLLIGTNELALLRLPALEAAWQHPLGKGKVVELALLDSSIAYQVSGSDDVLLLPRPTLPRPTLPPPRVPRPTP